MQMQIISKSMKMAKNIAKWRESASLIILSKDKLSSRTSADYEVLLLSRSEQSAFPRTSAFPGGVCEKDDESLLWSKYFQNMGIQNEDLQSLILERNSKLQHQPGIFQAKENDSIQRDISLRITAIRETFEETGILLCRDRKSLFAKNKNFGSYREDFDRLHWQHLVHNDAAQFLNLCQMLDVVPDLWSLNEWSVWLTPACFKKRFETVFYMTALENTPSVILEENESTHYRWIKPKDALLSNIKADIHLAPPQYYELSRLLNFNELNEVQQFAEKRAENGSILLLPVLEICNDGMVSLYPGDSDYPREPNAPIERASINLTLEQYRLNAKKLNRAETKSVNFSIFYNNFPLPDGHLKPINLSNDSKL